MAEWEGISAAIVCVAINAFPELAHTLHQLAAVSTGDQEMLDALLAHGGERFGERDNRRELGALQRWLDTRLECGTADPSMYDVVRGLLGAEWPGGWTMAQMQLAAGGGMEAEMRRRWPQDAHDVPALVLVRARIPVAELARTPAVDLADADAQSRQARDRERESARAASVTADALARSIGEGAPSDVVKALGQVRAWLAAVDRQQLQSVGVATDSDALARALAPAGWAEIAERVDAQQRQAHTQQQRAERERRYVLRAFLVRRASGEHVVVRRFGAGAGHYAELGRSGVCRAARLQDIEGETVESLWVCDSDEAAGGNMVVADPDDEIFCGACGGDESWPYNQIILCDGCDAGVHQICHDPVVSEAELAADTWHCGLCRVVKRARIGSN
ncbi:mitochondrial transcription factor 2 [Coemansia sp. RSA 2610]|nr:mitochondrial transcription factor 2 [Coemansia sp. RSA 2705]KAJ2360052.1 mitochondrial transcription factor 2 [Coemansia sp. RSA 2610]